MAFTVMITEILGANSTRCRPADDVTCFLNPVTKEADFVKDIPCTDANTYIEAHATLYPNAPAGKFANFFNAHCKRPETNQEYQSALGIDVNPEEVSELNKKIIATAVVLIVLAIIIYIIFSDTKK